MAHADAVAQAALTAGATDVEALKSAKLPSGETVEEARAAAIAKLGENMQIRRLVAIDSANNVAAYVHGGKIGVLVEVKGGDADLARLTCPIGLPELKSKEPAVIAVGLAAQLLPLAEDPVT